MTEKELHRLSRQDLLQLLLTQSREVARQKESAEALKKALSDERNLTDRLKEKLDDKDATIERLKERLDDKDATINRLKRRLDDKDDKLRKLISTVGGSVPAEWLLDRTESKESQPQPQTESQPASLYEEGEGELPAAVEPQETFSESVEERLRRLKDQIAEKGV